MINTSERPVQVHLIAQPLVCWGLERLVQSAHPRFGGHGVSSTLPESLGVLERQQADVVVLDFDGAEHEEALEELQTRSGSKVLLLTGLADLSSLDKAVVAGVRGVVRKREPPAVLLKAIEKIQEG